MDLYQKVGEQIDKIEAEMKRIGLWREEALPPEAFVEMGAFGINTMSVEEWIEFVLIPRVRGIIAEKGDFPAGSAVATYAIRNLDGIDEADKLIDLLIGFDQLFN